MISRSGLALSGFFFWFVWAAEDLNLANRSRNRWWFADLELCQVAHKETRIGQHKGDCLGQSNEGLFGPKAMVVCWCGIQYRKSKRVCGVRNFDTSVVCYYKSHNLGCKETLCPISLRMAIQLSHPKKVKCPILTPFLFFTFFFGFLGELGYVLSLFDARTGSRHV